MRIVANILRTIALLFVIVLAAYPAASTGGYLDISGHKAEEILKQAARIGLITSADRYLYPDENISVQEAVFIVSLITGKQDNTRNNFADTTGSDIPISQASAHALLTDSFALIDGIGIADGLPFIKADSDEPVTRADFLTNIFHITGNYTNPNDIKKNIDTSIILLGDGYANVHDTYSEHGVWLGSNFKNIRFKDAVIPKVTILSQELESLEIHAGTNVEFLVLAAETGDITVTPVKDAVVETLVVTDGLGEITISGIKNVIITGSMRRITITDDADTVIISGRDCHVDISPDVHIENIILEESSGQCLLFLDGTAGRIEVFNDAVIIAGGGSADTMQLAYPNTSVGIDYTNLAESADLGLQTAYLKLEVPDMLPIGETLTATADLTNVVPGKECILTWYIDGAIKLNRRYTTGRPLPELRYDYTYTYDMPKSAVVMLKIRYTSDDGEPQVLSAEKTFVINNYSKQEYIDMYAEQVLAKVTTAYKGDFTLRYAQRNDYTDFEKFVWINSKDYSSSTEYLIWINLSYQRVNIFMQDEDGYWDLVRSCIVGSGSPRTPTPTGITIVSYKYEPGWHFTSYIVRPVVGFYPGTGYAFHSRLYYPNWVDLYDPGIGYPISHGCIRMYDDDLMFIYDNIPLRTTVVIY